MASIPDGGFEGVANWLAELPMVGMIFQALFDKTMTTTDASTTFALVAGIGGAVSQMAASERLSQYPGDTIKGHAILPAIVVSAIASVFAGASLVPNSKKSVITAPDLSGSRSGA